VWRLVRSTPRVLLDGTADLHRPSKLGLSR
jgi:hypothetical protein